MERFLAEVHVGAVRLVAHDWGAAVGLTPLAHRHPERVERLVVLNAPPLFDGFGWPRLLKWWRVPLIGEGLMGSTMGWILARALRHGSVSPEAWTDERIESVWHQFDQGTQRAILRLVRSTTTELAAPTSQTPALIVWGDRDPWYAPALADAYAAHLRGAKLERLSDAGHWPWAEPERFSRARGKFPGGVAVPVRVSPPIRPQTEPPAPPEDASRTRDAERVRLLKRILPTFTAGVIALAYVLIEPRSQDLAAHLLRAKLFATQGFGIWNNWWYAGHNIPGYSVLFPPLAALFTPQLVAAISATVTAALFESLARQRFGEDCWLGALWFGVATSTSLFTGRLTFAFGLMPAVGSALALGRRRTGLAVALAFVTPLASPVGALFSALAGGAPGGLRLSPRTPHPTGAPRHRRGDRRRGADPRPGGRVPGGRHRAIRVLGVLADRGDRDHGAVRDPQG